MCGDKDEKRKKSRQKKGLKHYICTVRHPLEDEALKDRFAEDGKKTMNDPCDEARQWLKRNQEAAAEGAAAKKGLEAKYGPVMMRIYQPAGGSSPSTEGSIPGTGATSGNEPGVDGFDPL